MIDIEQLPNEMRAAIRWLVWRLEPNQDPTKKPRKVPYYANGARRSGEMDSDADRANFATLDDALQTLQGGSFTGLGFALGPDGAGGAWQGIDLDDIPGRPHLVDLADDLPGYVEDSPSGKGKHAIGYGRPFQSLGSKENIGIEAYAAGRFFTVTGEGSGIRPPTCLADFVETRLKPMHNKGSPRIPQGNATPAPAIDLPAHVIAELRSALLHMEADDRHHWVAMGHALKTLGLTGRGLWMEWSATSLEKFDPADAAAKWATFAPTHTGYQAVFAEAQRRGWLNPASKAANGTQGDFGGKATPNHHPNDAKPTGTVSGALACLQASIIRFNELENAFDPIPHIVDKWIPAGEVTLLAGHGGGGKSFVALSLAVHVALGWLFAGLQVTQTKVLFFSAEDGAVVLRQRVAKICRAMNIDPMLLDGRLFLLDASDIDPALHREQRGYEPDGKMVTHTVMPLLEDIAELVKTLGAGLVVVDNASDTYDDDEIRRARVRAFVRSLRSHIARPDRAVLLLAHISKASASSSGSKVKEDYSGSTAWHNSVRSRLSLSPDGDDAFNVEHLKANLGSKASPIRFEWSNDVPMFASTGAGSSPMAEAMIKAAQMEQDENDMTALVAVITDFDNRGETITTSMHGAYTVFKLLSAHRIYPKHVGGDRLPKLLRELESAKRIFRATVRTPDRKYKQVFTCRAPTESAPNAGSPSPTEAPSL